MSFTVFKSSAGSGKTYNLVKSYLEIALKRPSDFKSILAITFTNKAAAEMKSRIVETLQKLASTNIPDKAAQLRADLSRETGLTQEEITANAAKALDLILHNYSDFAVSTIDSFVLSIVRTFAKDLNIPFNFDIEMSSDVLTEQATDLLVSRVGTREDITALLVRFIENRVDEQGSINIENDIRKICRYLFNEESIVYIERLRQLSISDFFRLQQFLFNEIRTFNNHIKTLASQAQSLIQSKNINPDSFYYKKNGLPGYFKRLSVPVLDGIFNKNVAKGVENGKWTSDACTPADAAAIEDIKDALEALYMQIQQAALSDMKQINLYVLIARNIFTVAVIDEIAAIIEDIKLENNLLHISEFNKKIASVIVNEPVPFIYERTGTRFSHIMIDEFQDTSVLQWFNLLPLVENALASGGTALVVGDAKQAIYRFRDGDADQFIRLPEVATNDFSGNESPVPVLAGHYKEHVLGVNYRSQEQIVAFNNAFFTHVAASLPECYRPVYAQVEQKSADSSGRGYVEISFFENKRSTGIEPDYNRRIKQAVDELLAHGYKPSDITILCRSNKNASETAQYLIGEGIGVVSSESLLLATSPEVGFLVALLAYIYDVNDHKAMLMICRYLSRKGQSGTLSLHEFASKSLAQRSYLNTFLSQNFAGYAYDRLRNLPLYELTENLIRLFALNAKPDAFVHFFLDAVFNFSTNTSDSIKGFLDWWDDNRAKCTVIVPEGINAVQIMTIHKSKGLQFPVVIFPYATEKKKTGKQNLWVDINDEKLEGIEKFLIPANKMLLDTPVAPAFEEEDNKSILDLVNVLYVALTRPVEKLFIISELPGEKESSVSVNGFLRSYLKASGVWNDTQMQYHFGTFDNKKDMEETPAGQMFYDTFVSLPWKDRIVMKYKSRNPENTPAGEERLQRGLLVHAMMGMIHSEADIDAAVDSFYARATSSMPPADDIKSGIRRIISNPLISPFYTNVGQAFNEKDIFEKGGAVHRPDRFVRTDTRAAVIDYKTGKPDESYRAQLDNYANLLEEMGISPIEKYIVYIDSETVENW